MESAGAAQAAHLNLGVPMIAVRGISDLASGGKDASDQLGWRPIAARSAAAFALGLMSELELDARAPDEDEDRYGRGNMIYRDNQIHVHGDFVGRDRYGNRS